MIVQGNKTDRIDKSEYKTIADPTPWNKNWGGDYNRYKSTLESLTPKQETSLYYDSARKNPKIMDYYKSADAFINAAKDNKVGIVHNSIVPTYLDVITAEPMTPKTVDLTVPTQPQSLQKMNVPSYAKLQRRFDMPRKELATDTVKNPSIGYSKLGVTSGGMGLVRGSNVVGRTKSGLVDTNKKWIENSVTEPLLQNISGKLLQR